MTWLRQVASRSPLRFKLVAALLILVTVALAASGAVAAASLRSYLSDRLDAQLQATAADIARRADRGPLLDRGGRPEFAAPAAHFFLRVRGVGPEPRNLLTEDVTDPPSVSALDEGAASLAPGEIFTVGSEGGGEKWRATTVPFRGGTITAALSLEELEATVRRLVLIEVIVGVVVLALLAGLGYAVVRSSLRPLVEVEEIAAAIAAGDLSRRVPDHSPDTEVGRLARALNVMLTRIENAFQAQQASESEARASEERMRRFAADASHELRTPLTSIRGFAELYRQGAVQEPGEVARTLRRIEDEAVRMGLLVDDLLLLARLDQQRPLERRPVDLAEVAVDAVSDARVLAPKRPIELKVREGTARARR